MKRLVLLVVALIFALCTTGMAETIKVEKASSTKESAKIKSTNKTDNSEKALNRAAEIQKARKENAENAYNVKSGKSQNTDQSSTQSTSSSTESTSSNTGSKSKSDLAYERCIKQGGTKKQCGK